LGLDTLRTLKSPIPKCLHDLPSLPWRPVLHMFTCTFC
jgi:hypothetical protein